RRAPMRRGRAGRGGLRAGLDRAFAASSARRSRTREHKPGAGSLRRLRGLSRPGWLDASELRIGLGCMRLPDDEAARATIAAAVEAGVTVFDTARAYEGNERLLAAALRAGGVGERARIVTKGGMSRAGGGWVPDGRARTIAADYEASLAALD